MSQTIGELIRKSIEDYVLVNFNMIYPRLDFTSAAKNGDNFASDVFRVKVTSTNGCGSEEGSNTSSFNQSSMIDLIVKVSPQDVLRRKMYPTAHLFAREYYAYSTIFPAFEKFQLKHLDESIIFTNYPRMLAGSLEEKLEFIVLEDLCSNHYHTSYRPTALDYAKCLSVIKSLAQFHAISFAFKDQQSSTFAGLISSLDEIVFKEEANKILDQFLHRSIEHGLSTLSSSDQDQKVKMQLEMFKEIYANLMRECVNAKDDAVVLHGDCWMSNLLFKEVGDEITLKLVDWQGLRYGSPAIDLSYFLFCCTDSKLRVYLPELLTFYHTQLTSRIKELGSEGDKLFPFTKLEMHMKKYARFGLGMAMLTLHVTTCDPNDMPNLTDPLILENSSIMENITNNLVSRPAYRQRISDVCRDIIKFGYL